MRRHWSPCRVCGAEHTNPHSSGICPSCGAKEREDRISREAMEAQTYEANAFGQFMSLPEDERWRMLFEHMESSS